jgi:hypothetical protein
VAIRDGRNGRLCRANRPPSADYRHTLEPRDFVLRGTWQRSKTLLSRFQLDQGKSIRQARPISRTAFDNLQAWPSIRSTCRVLQSLAGIFRSSSRWRPICCRRSRSLAMQSLIWCESRIASRRMFPGASASRTRAPQSCAPSQTTLRNLTLNALRPRCQFARRGMRSRCRELGLTFFPMS